MQNTILPAYRNYALALLIARIGVGVGEAGASPPSHSLISDYFPIEKRATALSIYTLGIPFGSIVGNFLGDMYLGPSFAMTQALVTPRMRAVASAILLFMLNLIGMGLGPYFVGIASDLLAPATGHESLRYAHCLAVLVNVWATAHYFLGARTLNTDLAKHEQTTAAPAAAA